MKKFYFLGLAMLFGVVNIGHAQVEIRSVADLQAAKDSLSKIDGYTKKISDNTSLINTYQVQLAGEDKDIVTEKTETKTEDKGYGGDERTAFKNFYEQDIEVEMKFGLYIDTSNRKNNVLYVYAPGQTENNPEDKITESYTVKSTDYSDETSLISKGNKISKIYMYYKFPVLSADKSTIEEYVYKKTNVYSTTIPAGSIDYDVTEVLEQVAGTLPDPDINYVTITTTTTTTETTPNKKYTTYLTNMTNLKTENSYYNALLNGGTWTVYSVVDNEEVSETSEKTITTGCNAYKKLSIEESLSIEDANFTMGDWGTGYTINGKGNVITYPAGANGRLININDGSISNLGIVNGKIADTNNNSIKTAFETMDQNTYDLYDAAGTYTTSPISGELGYKVRQYFGLTINADGTLGTLDKKADDNIVYKAQWTDPVTKEIKTFYANEKEDNLSYNPTAGKKNMFVYVQDTDMKSTLEKSTNVVVNGVCANALFDDKTSEANNDRVYIPTGFTAKKLSYNRNFAKTNTYATVCLPFSVPATVYKAMGVTKIMQFNEIDNNNVYWFQYQEGSMNANEPYVLKFDEDNFGGGTIFNALEEIEIAATGNINPYAVAPENPGRGAEFLGLFLATNASTLAPAGSYNMYGFAEGRFRPIASTSPCQAFRTFVRTPKTSNAPATDLVIGELDELGNVVSGGTTGVNAAVADADAFSVKGGNGAVIITTGKAQKVSVYTVGGSLVKAANVEAGTVTVPVAAGVYIVNGKKVVVK